MKTSHFFLLAASAVAVASLLPAQEPKPAFPAEVELVTVDVVVVDRKGMPVSGLAEGDFTILEGGVPQKISRFEAVTLPDTPPAPEATARRRISTLR